MISIPIITKTNSNAKNQNASTLPGTNKSVKEQILSELMFGSVNIKFALTKVVLRLLRFRFSHKTSKKPPKNPSKHEANQKEDDPIQCVRKVENDESKDHVDHPCFKSHSKAHSEADLHWAFEGSSCKAEGPD